MTVALQGSIKARILLLDDNAFGLSARKSVLQELGHQVEACGSPHQALDLCANQAFDLIVTDYRMPDMNGIEFISELRKRGNKVPIILVSGFTDTLGFNEENTGAEIVLQKSAHEVPHLIRAINRLLRKQLVRKPAGSQRPSKTTRQKNTPT